MASMLKTVEDIARRLVKRYSPQAIILYGSRASGRDGEESDADLVVVKDTEKRPVERRIEAERLLADRAIAVDIDVYTPQEMNYLFSVGSPFIEDVVEKGRLLYMRKATSAWIRDAQEELDSAIILHKNEKHRAACYHTHQCAEKAFKALALEKGSAPKRAHDIIVLLNAVRAMGWKIDIVMDDAVFLNSIYRGRYPTDEGLLPHGEPSRENAKNAIAISREVLGQVRRLVQEQSASGQAGEKTDLSCDD